MIRNYRLFTASLALTLAVVSVVGTLPVAALASVSNTTASADQLRISQLRTRADAEASRRLDSLKKLDAIIDSTQKLGAIDKSNLTNSVNDAVTKLSTSKTKLDADTEVTAAQSDAQAIVDNYPMYALVISKVYLLKVVDTERLNTVRLTSFSSKLQTRLNSAKNEGQDVNKLQANLDSMKSKISAAKDIEETVNGKVMALSSTNYNSDHAFLEAQRDQLKTAHQDNLDAYAGAKSLVSSLKTL